MSKLIAYKRVFSESFQTDADIESLSYQDIPEWDSVGHMQLMAALEDEYDIELDIDDIIDFSSYSRGIEILQKYVPDLGA
jgi:acyl carrier protein